MFLHGMSRGFIDFRGQFEGALADRFRLIAYDLRGHGHSGKPWAESDYADSRVWAKDFTRVMDALEVIRPVVVGWSYGGIAALDALKVLGDLSFAGMNFVGNAATLANGAMKVTRPAADLFASLDARDTMTAYRSIQAILSAAPPDPQQTSDAAMLGMMTPTYVRRAIAPRSLDYRDVLRATKLPLLITMGDRDPGYSEDLADAVRITMPGARLSIYTGIGHTPMQEAPERFDRELAEFADAAFGRDCLA